MTSSDAVFYEKIYADTPEAGISFVEANVNNSTINLCPVPYGKDPYTLANEILQNHDPRVSVGNVGCIDLTNSSHNQNSNESLWLFFGWEVPE